MPSYVSRVTPLPTHVDEIDVDTLHRVTSYKQQRHDQGKLQVAQNLQAYKTSANELVRETDRKYMQERISAYADQINDKYALADFGDLSTLSGIDAMGSVYTKDERIMGAMKDSRSISSLLQNYNRIKTDPKLMDRYSKVNEDWDMQFVNQYMQNPESRYMGSATPTPYVDIDKKLSEGMSKLKADMVSQLGPDGYMTYIKGVGPEKIRTMVMNKLATNPQLASQLGINQWAKFRNNSDAQILSQFGEFKQRKSDALEAQAKELQMRMNLVTPDSKQAKALQSQIDFLRGKQKDILGMQARSINDAKNFLYMGELVDGYTAQFSWNEETKKSDPTAIAKWNLAERQRQHNDVMQLKGAQFELDQYYKQGMVGLKQEELGLKKQALEFKMSGSSGTGKSGTVNPLYSGQDPTVAPMVGAHEVETELNNLQNQNKAAVATGVLELISYNNPAFRSQQDAIKRFIGAGTTAENAYSKLTGASDAELKKAGISLDLKPVLLAKSSAMFRHLDAVALGAAPASDLRNMNNPIMSRVMQQLSHNYQGAKYLRDQLKGAETNAYRDLGVPSEKLQQINSTIAQYKRNPNSIPRELLEQAATELRPQATNMGLIYNPASSGLDAALSNPATRNKIQQRAIEMYRQQQIGVSPTSVREGMGKYLNETGLSRKSFTFPDKINDDARNVFTSQVAQLATENRGELDGATVQPVNFTQLADGSYRLRYVTERKNDEGKKEVSPQRAVIIPANQAQSIEQFLPKGWGEQAPYSHYQRALASPSGGLYMMDGKTIMGLYSEGNFNIPYSLQRYNMSDPTDPRVRVIVNKAVGAGTRWVDAPKLGTFSNAASAIEAMNQLGQAAYSQGQRNVQTYINTILK